MDDQQRLFTFLRDEINTQRATGFDLLRRMPVSYGRLFLDYFAHLTTDDQDALVDGLARLALTQFIRTDYPNDPALERYRNTSVLMADWRYNGLRTLKASVNSLPEDLREQVIATEIARAKQIRKRVQQVFETSFNAKTTRLDIEHWRYTWDHDGASITMTIDYGGNAQLRYGVWVSVPERGIQVPPIPPGWAIPSASHITYATLMGLFGAFQWDLIEANRLDETVALLREQVIYCIDFAKRMPR